jgi:hypothetical protein
MKRTILVFGFLSGAISSLLMIATVPFLRHSDPADSTGYVVGYTGMVLAFLMVFFGIRSYRENVGAGEITFVRGFTMGIAITLISCICYVITWEIVYFNFMHGFMDSYFAGMAAKAKASSANPAQIAAQLQQMQRMKEMYENPLWNAAFTFIEPFPVGLVITLISAGILRRKPRLRAAESAVTAS